MIQSDISIYLPKYLSAESYKKLLEELKSFPSNIDSRFYTSTLKEEKNIFQGDCLEGLPIYDLSKSIPKDVSAIILSNTCDIDPANPRLFNSSIVYAPIIDLQKYRSTLLESGAPNLKVENHLSAIKSQAISQILYLPENGDAMKESVVFLDRLHSLPMNYIASEKLLEKRRSTLSNYGAYLFLFKLSVHFSRIQDQVDRDIN